MPPDDKTLWITLGAATVYVWDRAHDLPTVKRLTIALMAGAMGYGAAIGDIFPGWNPILVGVAVTALGPLALDTAAALIKDRSAILELIKGRFK